MRIAAVIPARMQSARLPGKPLRRIAGVPMILRVLARAEACTSLNRVIVATDSQEIFDVVDNSGGEALMTSTDHRTGSDRVAEVAAQLGDDLILNIQCDEPLLPLSTVQGLVQFGLGCKDLYVATAMVHLSHERDALNPNIVKVVRSKSGRALYFSRYPIPYRKSSPFDLAASEGSDKKCTGYYKHIGIYLYRREFLLEFIRLPQARLEQSEDLEQLRILENDYPMNVVEVLEDSVGVDTEEDLLLAESIIAAGEQVG